MLPPIDTLRATVPIATLTFDFDPLLRLADGIVVRWVTVALAATLVATLIALALMARRTAGLRADDLLFIAIGVVPGAVLGGRLGFALLHLDLYRAAPMTLFDPAVGGLELALAVVGGAVSGGYVGHLLGAPVGRWLHVGTVPLLVALGAGKLAMALGGAGQGRPTDLGWATAYGGPGPWSTLAPALPSHPSQIYEGIATLVLAAVIAVVLGVGGFRSRDGRLFLVSIGAWAVVRMALTTTWRDPAVLGPLPAGGVIALLVAFGAVLALVTLRRRSSPLDRADPAPLGRRASTAWADRDGRR